MNKRIAALIAFALAALGGMPTSAQTSPSAYTTGYRYDIAGHLTGVIKPDPDGSGPLKYAAVRNSYDSAGRLIEVEIGELSNWQSEYVDPIAWTGFNILQTQNIEYDTGSRKLKETRSSGTTTYAATQYSYDAAGRLDCAAVRMNPAIYNSLPPSACTLGTAGSDGPDRITKAIYDDTGQVLKVQKAYGITVANGFPATLQQDYQSYAYTPNGKQAYVIDANGNKSAYGYDGFDRLTLWAFPSITTPGAASTTDFEQYGYDANGNRTSLRKRDGRGITYFYDALNRVTSKILAGGGACVSGYACTTPPSWAVRNVYYAYDLRGLQTAARFDSASGADAIANAYDGFGRLTSSTVSMSGVSRTVGHLYDADGNRIRVTHPDGNYFTYDYDGLDRLVVVKQNGTTQIASVAYNAKGLRASAARDGVLTSYTYDDLSRLSGQTDDLAGTASDYGATFVYNPASQIVSYGRSNDSYAFTGYATASTAYTANALNQYSAVGGGSLGYDSNGNLSANGGTSFTYDVENRLVTATGTLTANLVYDPLGRLYSTTAGFTFVYDGDELIDEYNAAGTLAKRYVHGSGEDDPLFQYIGPTLNNRYSLQADHQGSIISLADSAGALGAINTYDEYGVPGATNFGRFQYTGQIYLSELGMYYYKARIYSSRLGRFLQTDPIGYKDQMDLYAYVANDPLNHADPTGKDAIVIVQANGDTSVIIPLTFSGDAATPANVAQFMSGVNSASQVVDGHNVTFTAVQGTSSIDPSVKNTMVLTNGPTSPSPTSEGNSGHSYVFGGTQGHVTMADVKGRGIVAADGQSESRSLKTGMSVEAHEAAGHMAGLNDSSAKGNLMGPGNGTSLTPSQVGSMQRQGGESNGVVNTVVRCSSDPTHIGC